MIKDRPHRGIRKDLIVPWTEPNEAEETNDNELKLVSMMDVVYQFHKLGRGRCDRSNEAR